MRRYQSKLDHGILVESCRESFEKLDEIDKEKISILANSLTEKMKQQKIYFSDDQALVILAAIGLSMSGKRFSEAMK